MTTAMPSPFHQGEQKIQNQLGVRDQMEQFGRRVIRDYMPEQHRDFYQQLPYLFAGFSDADGQPWASILFASESFVTSPDEKHLIIEPELLDFDPLNAYLQSDDEQKDIALLGVELETRRRNRLSASLLEYRDKRLHLKVKQSFGNCPQYIQARSLQQTIRANDQAKVQKITRLNQHARTMISTADTFFVASCLPANALGDGAAEAAGADISHRGGQPGFIRVDDDGLTIPDYAGNNHFNTLGNFIENPKAGLLFIDFDTGDVLTLTGSVELDFSRDEIEYFKGAQRLWRFRMTTAYLARSALKADWQFGSWSANTLLTGTWEDAQEQAELAKQQSQFKPLNITAMHNENAQIMSFVLKPQGRPVRQFKPGQFLTLRANIGGKKLTRCYSLSSAPSDDAYRISVKRDGVFSRFLHGLSAGDTIEAQAPNGAFFYDLDNSGPALMLAAGVGITPFIAMLRESVNHAIAKRYFRPAVLVVSAKDLADLSFVEELNQVVQASQGRLHIVYCLTRLNEMPAERALNKLGLHAENCFIGRLDYKALQQIIRRYRLDQDASLNRSLEAYLCGPDNFMQAQYNALIELGLSDERIKAEAFGPASIKRHIASVVTADDALVAYADPQGKELMALNWQSQDGSLLSFALQHGLEPSYSCQQGFCGNCRAKLHGGEVVYTSPLDTALSSSLADDEVILCCAAPAPDSDIIRLAFID